MRIFFLLSLIFSLSFFRPLQASAAQAPAPATATTATASDEKEYYGAVLLLVDAPAGMIGVQWEDEGGKKEKLAFHLDPDNVTITNYRNESFELSELKVGETIDILTVRDASGREMVDTISSYRSPE